MEFPDPVVEPVDNKAIIVKADEVDEAGADISTILPKNSSGAEFDERIESRRAQDAQAGGRSKVLANDVSSSPKLLARPNLQRNSSAAPPPQQPPPPAPSQQREDAGNPTDSLSLMQLRRLVTDLPKLEPTAYAFEYEDTRTFPEELEEWFQYTEEERYTLLRAKQTFDEKWEQAQATRIDSSDKALEWTDVEPADRESFLVGAVHALTSTEITTRVKSLECISYISLGIWGETAGIYMEEGDPDAYDGGARPLDTRHVSSKLQLKWIHGGARLLCKVGAIQALINVLRRICDVDLESSTSNDPSFDNEEVASRKFLLQIEVNHTLTALYVLTEVGRGQLGRGDDNMIRRTFGEIESSLPSLLVQILAKLRWEETSVFPFPRVLLLLWKTIILLFGSSRDLKESKAVLRDSSDETQSEHREDFITASPLDYHLFRQEITSKYPSYCPPPPLVPIELENNSILPPLPNHPSRRPSQESLHTRVGPNVNGGGSIFNQPVHIATPAPSPPPSPAGPGGKGGKKQNYQTNQNFPFLYPPLDDTSNNVGGKGNAELQDQLVGKRWEGSDVPASILEAGQLFASRMRMSRSIRQLWDIREKFIKYERGWNGSEEIDKTFELLHLEPDEKGKNANDDGPETEAGMKETEDESVQQRLNMIENFYRISLPHLQSLVIVLWKVTFANVSALVSQSNGPNGIHNGFPLAEDTPDPQGKRKSNPSSAVQTNGTANGQLSENEDGTDAAVEELNAVRLREITSKAVSGIILMLLKWFKLSHVLKFEYLTQLLLDANYLPLILKLFAHQDIDRAVDQRNDREDLDFFNFCVLNSKHPPAPALQPHPSPSPPHTEDSAPAPILTQPSSPSSSSSPSPVPSSSPPPRPEVDELGYPTTGTLPASPLTTYAPRFFFTTISLLRLLQKITKRKAHRALLLVQYKSSTILRRALKIPQPQLRLYTLKLFKSQVPYCGRKWRQTNMRVITAIYLHCKPELRDEWLCGGDVDGVVEEAVPLEQAGRSLVHWWHLREYRGAMKGVRAVSDEGNFFERELEKMGCGVGGVGPGEDEDDGGQALVAPAGGEWEGGPLQLEGWT